MKHVFHKRDFDPLTIFSFEVFPYIVLPDSNFGGKWNLLGSRRLLSDQNNDNKHFHMQTPNNGSQKVFSIFPSKAIECSFYKAADNSWNPPLENKIDFYSFYYYFRADPPEHHAKNYFSYFYNKSAFRFNRIITPHSSRNINRLIFVCVNTSVLCY